MTRKEGGHAVCQAALILEVEQVAGVREHERLHLWQPLEQQLLPLVKTRVAVLADDGENGLRDSARLWRPERPLPQRR